MKLSKQTNNVHSQMYIYILLFKPMRYSTSIFSRHFFERDLKSNHNAFDAPSIALATTEVYDMKILTQQA